MPGIAGLIVKHQTIPPTTTAARMLAAMLHSKQVASGQVDFASLQASVAWVAPAGSFSDCMPVWNDTKDLCLVFFGEHFSDGKDFDRFHLAGQARDNARWLLGWYAQAGDGFLRGLNGNFSGVIADLRGKVPKIILFNDRFGLGRIYYHEDDTAFYFASEAKALLAVVPPLRQLDSTALAEYFSCGCALNDRSLFSGVHLLPVAAAWEWQPGRARLQRTYFDAREWENQPVLPADEFYARFKEVLTRITPHYLTARQPIAMSVTGGVDSRMIMAALRPPAGSLPCYTFGGMYRECADVRVGRQVAEACQQSHEVLEMSPRFFVEFPDLAAQTVFLTDGVMDVSGAASLFVNRLGREMAPIRLTGNYGGEILRRITVLKAGKMDESLFDPGFTPGLRAAATTLASLRQGPAGSFIAFKQVPWYHYAMYALESSQLTVRTPYLDNELVALSYQAPPEFHLNKNPAFRFIMESDPRLSRVPTDRGTVWKPAAPLESRRSRLRWLREEFWPKAEYAYDYGMPNWLAQIDRLLSPFRMERIFLGHQKYAHYRIWYRRELSGFVRDILLDPLSLSRSFLNRRRVEEIVSAHTKGTANHTLTIHKLLSCELIHRTLLERP